MRKGNILPIAVMALAIAGFIVLVYWAVTPGLKWPWSPDSVQPASIDELFPTHNKNNNAPCLGGTVENPCEFFQNENVPVVTNTSISRINQQPLGSGRIFYSTQATGSETINTLQTITYDGKASNPETTPAGYTRLTFDQYRLAWLQGNGKIWLWDREKNTIQSTSLPNPLTGETVYEVVGPYVYSSDLHQVIVQYAKFDKNSEAYKSEFAGPNPVSSKYYTYTFLTDQIILGPSNLDTFYDLWDQENGFLYTHRAGEGIGSASPVTRISQQDGSKVKSADYGNNSGPAFSSDGKKMAIPVPDSSPLKIHIFDLPNITTPSLTLTLSDVKDASPENVLGYIYNLEWFNNNSQLVLSFSHSGYVIDVTTGTATKFFEEPKFDPNTSSLQWDQYPAFPSNGSIFVFETSIRYPVPRDNVTMKVIFNAYNTTSKKLSTIKEIDGGRTVYPFFAD